MHRSGFPAQPGARTGDITRPPSALQEHWPPLERWAGPMFEQGILGILHIFASKECGVGTLPGSMGFMATTMPQVHSCTRNVHGEERQCPPVHVHAMGLGNAKSYLTRLDDILSWCTLEDSTSGKQAYFWPATPGARIIAAASVTSQMKPARFTPLENTTRQNWRRCNPLLHPSMTTLLQGRTLPHVPIQLPMVPFSACLQ